MKLLTERITALGGLGGTQERTSTYAAWLSTVSERASGRGEEGRPLAYAAWLSTVSERVLLSEQTFSVRRRLRREFFGVKSRKISQYKSYQ